MKVIVTTSHRSDRVSEKCQEFLNDTGFEFIPRDDKAIEYIQMINNAHAVIVWNKSGPVLHIGMEKFFFHPSLAYNRILAYRRSNIHDPLIKACALNDCTSFLDCTLGLGADAIVASYFVPNGSVVGIESSPLIASLVKWGMMLYSSNKSTWLNNAISRIKVLQFDHLEYLKILPEASIDVIYFDPMFRTPIKTSEGMMLLRSIAITDELSSESIEEACRVARKRVVIKERANGYEFERLGFNRLPHSKNNPIQFGIINVI